MAKCTNCVNGYVTEICTVCVGQGGIKQKDGTVIKCPNPLCKYGSIYRVCKVCKGTGENGR